MTNINDTGICNIVVEGVTIPLRFGMPANRAIIAKLAESPAMLTGETINEQGITHLIYAGYVNACMASDKAPDKTFDYFFAFVEDCVGDPEGERTLNEVAQCYANSRHTKKQIKQIEAATEEIKKKTNQLTGTPSNPSATENLG